MDVGCYYIAQGLVIAGFGYSFSRLNSRIQELEKIKDRIKQALVKEFNITHSTLEFEHPDYKHEGAHTYGHG